MSKIILNHPLFDGKKVIERASVTIENGIITSVGEADTVDTSCLLMPGLIDAHTHMRSKEQAEEMVRCGILATCDVCAPLSLRESSEHLDIFSSAGMIMGAISGKNAVKSAINEGAQYIKVLLFEPNLLPRPILSSICREAHEASLKVAVHATSVKAEKMAVECGANILLHVPMKEELPEALAREIAERGVAVAPTLVMMKAFAESGSNGYLPEHYKNAENAVRTLRRCGVTLLVATDANIGNIAPAVEYGASMHREAELLCRADLTPLEVLEGATSKVAEVFGIDGIGSVEVGKRADLILIDGRPDKSIDQIKKIKHIFIRGDKIL